MRERDRKEAAFLRSLSSEEAATFLLETYDDTRPATITRRSWKKSDQIRLARKFIRGQAHAAGHRYRDFLTFMSIDAFLTIVEDGLAEVPPNRLDLLAYHLLPSLRAVARTEAQKARVQRFARRLSDLQKQ